MIFCIHNGLVALIVPEPFVLPHSDQRFTVHCLQLVRAAEELMEEHPGCRSLSRFRVALGSPQGRPWVAKVMASSATSRRT